MQSFLLLFLSRLSSLSRNQHCRCIAKNSKRPLIKGFTLIELLISLVISSVVMTGLLAFVVELTSIDKRETNLDQVQRDMNRAMEYMVDDLKEAVYVYPDPQTVAAQLTADSAFPGGTGEVPVLAFWRIDPIETLPDCSTGSAAFQAECSLLEIRQAAYTLVVYAQKVNDGNQNWSGQSRIIRYELSKYSDLTALTIRAGYRDPTDPEDPLASFEAWQNSGTPSGNSDVLIDYVQSPTFNPPVALNRAPLSDAGGACRGYGLDVNGSPLYGVVPS
ncbi:MAG: prepilin-type N-terminal cleavage/methylation domain-containing protein, partial [Cyanobacteria bacterium J06632_3]